MKTINTSNHIIIPKKWDKELKSQELLDNLNSVSEEDIKKAWAEVESKMEEHEKIQKLRELANQRKKELEMKEKQEEEEKKKDEEMRSLWWEFWGIKVNREKWLLNDDEVINFLRDKFVKIENNTSYLWCRWNSIHLEIPDLWVCKWIKLDCFEAEKFFNKKNFEANKELVDNSFKRKEIAELLKTLNIVFRLVGLETDWDDMDYEANLDLWYVTQKESKTINLLSKLLNIDCYYWLQDTSKSHTWKRTGQRSILRADTWMFIQSTDDESLACLLLKK